MAKFKEGMYVRCPIDPEDPFEPRIFAIGQIISVDDEFDQVEIKFYDYKKIRKYFSIVPETKIYDFDSIYHCKILNNTEAFNSGTKGKIIELKSKNNSIYHHYYFQTFKNNESVIKIVNEKNLKVQFTRDNPDPLTQMKNYEFQNPIWYKNRRIVSDVLHTLNNSSYGFEILVGSRVYLLSHQVDTIIKAIRDPKCRFMLADEVGLGKTIEACVILKGLMDKNPNLKTVIIVPDSLVQQWANELFYKFWLDIPIWGSDCFNLNEINNLLILPSSMVNTKKGKNILSYDWDMLIYDEAHNLISCHEMYDIIYSFSKRVDYILLLSATPIQERRDEYKALLSLLMPDRYGEMSDDQFNTLLDKQRDLREIIYSLMRDIDYYYEDDLIEEYEEELCFLSEQINDSTFNDLISEIEETNYENKLAKVKLALSYISQYYQIEKNIIRHRRLEIQDILPERKVEKYSYTPAGANYGYYELETYNKLINYLDKILKGNFNDNSWNRGEFVKTILSAFFSSPWALKANITKRKGYINQGNYYKDNDDIMRIDEIEGEKNILNDLLKLIDLWQEANENELAQLEKLYDNPDLAKGRLALVMDYLMENTIEDSKYVIFTSWLETLSKLKESIIDCFGKDSLATFHRGMKQEQLQLAADRFQDSPKCKFILCDELGGEGRNFQNAEAVIHVDLPWSPMKLEQRIGRLDRIGRDKNREVLSLVFFAQETIEEYLLKIWDQGLNIFSESVSGIEIAIEDIYKSIIKELSEDIRYGLKNSLHEINSNAEEIRDLIEEERYYDAAKQLDYRLERQLTALIEKFDKDGGKKLFETMMSWTKLTGFIASDINHKDKIVTFKPNKISIASMKNTFFIPPDMKETHKHLSKEREVTGTFSRDIAIKHEDLIFYAPGDPFFDSIVYNAKSCARGRCTAIAKKTNKNWQGFIFTWSPEIDKEPLLKINKDIVNLIFAQGYLTLEQIITIEPISDVHKDFDENEILNELNESYEYNRDNFAHLGKRSFGKDFLGLKPTNLKWFKNEVAPDGWNEIMNKVYKSSKKKAKEQLKNLVDLDKASDDLQKHINGLRSSNLFYESNNTKKDIVDLNRTFSALHKGLENPKLRLDSIAFFWMVNMNE